MNFAIQPALIGAASGAAFGYVFFIKKAGGSKFDSRKMLQPIAIGALAGCLLGWQGQDLSSVEGVLEKAGSAGLVTALVQVATRFGGPLLSGFMGNLSGNLGGILKNIGK